MMSNLRNVNMLSLSRTLWDMQVRCFAARRGTRAKADKKKKSSKVEVKKVGFIPHNLREKAMAKGPGVSRRLKEVSTEPLDDVWVARFHQWKVYSFEDAILSHRETHHPQIYNVPNALVYAHIELDMRTAKKTKFVDAFSRVSKVDHEFDHGDSRSILVFCKTQEMREEAEAAGATLVGDVDLIKKIEKGDFVLPDFNYVLAHPNILAELVSLRNTLKKKFPNPKIGSLGVDMGNMVRKFSKGIQYNAYRDESELDYGWVEAPIGTLDMDPKHLESNFKFLINDIIGMRPKREGPFITRVRLTSPPSVEKLKIDVEPYLPDEFKKDAYESDSDDEVAQKVAQ